MERKKIKKTIKKEINNPCIICGKEVIWGKNGCPIIDKKSEIGILFGSWKGMKHYNC